MNGVHDMGGMQCMGPVRPERNEPVFHARWEGRVLAMALAMFPWRKWNLDSFRFEQEKTPPAEYLRMSYYERWLAALTELLVKSGLATCAEVESGKPQAGLPKATPPVTAESVPGMIARGLAVSRDVAVAPRFKAGQRVRAQEYQSPRAHAPAALCSRQTRHGRA